MKPRRSELDNDTRKDETGGGRKTERNFMPFVGIFNEPNFFNYASFTARGRGGCTIDVIILKIKIRLLKSIALGFKNYRTQYVTVYEELLQCVYYVIFYNAICIYKYEQYVLIVCIY